MPLCRPAGARAGAPSVDASRRHGMQGDGVRALAVCSPAGTLRSAPGGVNAARRGRGRVVALADAVSR